MVKGGEGPDNCLETWDGEPGDRIVGGPGRDRWFADAGDRATGVEIDQVCFGA